MNTEQLRNRIREYCDAENQSGVLRVTHRDQILCADAFGYADREKKTEFDEDSLFTFYSLSKPFCALRWMQMKDGKPTALAWSGDIPLQEGRGAHILLAGDASKVILTFDEAKLDAYLDPDHYLVGRGMQAFLGIEEKKPSSGHSHKTLFDVKSQSGKELLSTLPAGGDGWDGVYLPIETDYSYLPVTGEGDAVYLPEIESGEDDTDPAPTPDPKPQGCGGVLSPRGLLLALAPVPFALRKRRA